MRIRPAKLIKAVLHSPTDAEDLLRKPRLPWPFRSKPATPVAFASGKLHFNGKDMGETVREAAKTDPQTLGRIAGQLEDYKKEQLKRARKAAQAGKSGQKTLQDISTALAQCEAWIARIADVMKSRYDETQSGLHVGFDDDGQLILNGMNVSLCLESCRENPNPKSRIFLKGVRNRLYHVLENRANARNHERLREAVTRLFEEIDNVLASPA